MTDESRTTLEGYIEHIVYRNEDNGYTVFSLTTEKEEVTCVGLIQLINEGESVRVTGNYVEHYSYGRQFKVTELEIRIPEDAEAIERYLGSGVIRGIGKALAGRIVKRFGEDTLRIMSEEPERLAEVKGISMRKAQEIAEETARQSSMRKAMIFLQQYGLSVSLSVKIYKSYGEGLYKILKENPYKMTEDIDGVGFKTADEIAARIGIQPDSEYRVRSGLLYVLFQATAEGHVYLPRKILLQRASHLLSVTEEVAEKALGDLIIERKAVEKRGDGDSLIYSGSFYYLELNCAHRLHELNVPCLQDERKTANLLEKLRNERTIQLDEQQEKAVELSARHGILILTGGPGTGKTTAINEMIRYFEKAHLSFLLAAPTGRAARRMTEATGYEASTIHRLLEIGPLQGGNGEKFQFTRNEQNPLEADVVIIDEMSMVDIFLMNALLMAIADGTRLILVGDADQLPSVGAGDVLRDLLKTGIFPTVCLKKIFRQAEGSDIILNAHAINEGRQIQLGAQSRDFFFLKRNDPEVIISQMLYFIKGKLPAYVGADELDIQVLSPMKKGALGVERLNGILQERLNPPDRNKPEKSFGNRLFRVGDKVMQVKNNYQLEWEIRGKYGIAAEKGVGIFNGDVGIIRQINDFAKEMTIEFDGHRTVDYPYALQEELELAYAVTIHKSQGSEYPAVILPILGGPQMLLTRNLLYTAVTRAKKCLVLMGDEDVIRMMIGNRTRQVRYTSLDKRLMELSDAFAEPDR